MTADAIAQHMEAVIQYHVAEIGGCFVGVVGIRDNQNLYHLFVHGDRQWQGIARKPWQTAIQSPLERGNLGEFTVNSLLYAKVNDTKLGLTA